MNRLATTLAITMASLLVTASAGAVSLVNPGFESGLSGWDAPTGLVQVVPSHDAFIPDFTWHPVDGSLFAVLTAGNPVTTISQVVAAKAGDTLSFQWFFDGADFMPFDDSVGYSISRPTGEPVYSETLASVSTVADYPFGRTPWTLESYTFESAGSFTFTYQVTNVGDGGLSSQAGIDMVALSSAPIPEPLTMLGMLAGVGGVAGYIRKRRAA